MLKQKFERGIFMKNKRGAALLCAACLIGTGAAVLPAPAAVYAAEEELVQEADGLKYEVNDGAVTITGFTSDLSGEVTVPAEIDGLPVTKIGANAFKYNADITEITLPDSITEIGTSAFYSCFQLKKVVLPKNLKSIADKTFEESRKLVTLAVPEQVKEIGERAFAKCYALSELTIPEGLETVGEDAFLDTPWMDEQRAKNPFVIINHVLIDGKACSGEITIPADVTKIGAGAFSYNYYITNVLVHENVTEIARYGFFNCTGLESITVLNPDCVIYDLDGTISNTYCRHVASFLGSIRGMENSTLQAFCEVRDYPFEVIKAEKGDWNLNGIVGADDAQNVLSAYADILSGNAPELSEMQQTAADVNGDGEINAADAQTILNYYVLNTIAETPTTWDELMK